MLEMSMRSSYRSISASESAGIVIFGREELELSRERTRIDHDSTLTFMKNASTGDSVTP